jgi:hypothetical protein
MNRLNYATFALIAIAFVALWFHQPTAAAAAPVTTYEFRLVTAGTSPDYLVKTLNDAGAQGFRAVGLVCLANGNQFATTQCVAQILMERPRRS